MTKLSHSYSALKMYENCPLRYRLQRIDKVLKDQGGEASLHGERIHEQLEKRLKGEEELPPESAYLEILCRSFESLPGTLEAEKEYTLNANLEPTGWWSDDAWLRSKLDILILDGSHAKVIDWKTGKHRPDFVQLELFALQVFTHHREVNSVQSIFLWTKDKKMDHQTFEREEAPALWNKLLGRISRVEQSLAKDEWPAKPSGLCPWCPAKGTPHCKFS